MSIRQEGMVLIHWLSKKETSAEAHRGASEHSEGFKTEAGEMGKTQQRKMFSLVLHQSQLYGRVTTGK